MNATDHELDAKISLLYTMELSAYQIARRLGTTRDKVMRALRRTNTQIRTVSQAKRLKAF